MINNYFKTAWRTLWKNKGYSAINITGLAVGLAAVLIIALWVQNQFRHDNFYTNKENIHKLWTSYTDDNDVYVHDITSAPAAPALEEGYPEVIAAARMYWPSDKLLSYDEKAIKSIGNEVDGSFLEIFDFPVVNGTTAYALKDNNSIVITESLAKSLFGPEDPINKTITLDNAEPYTVMAVLQDLPSYTDFSFNYLIPLKEDNHGKNWNTNTYSTYLRLQPGTDVGQFNKKIEPLVRTHASDLTSSTAIFLHPMAKMHLYSRFENGVAVGGKIEEVRLVVAIGLLILCIACVNFVNLSTARSQKRGKEIGVRKVIGASKSGLVKQFLLESVMLSVIAGLIAIGLVLLTLPLFSQKMDIPLSLDYSNTSIWLVFFGFIFLTGIMAGVYPALFLSRLAPVKTLKGNVEKKKYSLTFREVLVVLQFGTAIVLIIGTIIVRAQINYAGERNVGYNTAQLVEIPAEGDISKNFDALKAELLSQDIATSVTRTGWTITHIGSSASGNFAWEGSTPEQGKKIGFALARTDSDFISTLGLTLADGRDLDYNRLPGDSSSILLNEAAIATMKLDNPVGKELTWGGASYTIVGVFKDFIMGSPYNPVDPTLVMASKSWMNNILVRMNPAKSTKENLLEIEGVFKKFNPAYPFSYNFVDQRFAQKFKDQEQTAQLTLVFSVLAISISCLGLFGLISFIAETRTKEIGIRKVLGASVTNIVGMLSKDFVKLVIVAIFIASPIAWWAMSKWLEDFPYRITIQWWVFALAGLMAIVLAILTVASQAIRAAVANPVESLRDE